MKSKTNIGNVVNLDQLLEFEVAFPGETPLTPEEYLKGGSRDIILKVAAYFLGFKPYNSKFKDNRELLGNIFGPENYQFANEIYDKIKAIEKQGTKIGIISAYSSLKFFEYFFVKENTERSQTHAEFERNLFKAYLVLNSNFTEAQKIALSSTDDLDDDLKIPMKFFCMQYPIADKINYDINQIWLTQIVKAIYLFQFLEGNTKTQPLLAAFLVHFNYPTWEKYLKALLPLTIPAIKNENEAHTDISVTHDENFDKSCAFIEKLIIQDSEELDENDFISLRASPFYKVSDGVYRIIFNLFVVEKVFKGVYFLLRDINDRLPGSQKIKQLKSMYGDEFSEKILLYKVIESIYPNKCTRYSGKELSEMRIDKEPDYYVRKGKSILLFESKDFLILADKKQSFDYNIYEQEFQRVLYYEDMPGGKEKHKAVMQLINNIRRLLKTEFPADTKYHYKEIFIYPILIIHDHQFDTPGFNHLLNYWFQDELQGLKEEGLFIHHVKPLVVVNIDSLIYNQVGLASKVTLSEVLDNYISLIKVIPQAKFNSLGEFITKFIPFSLFINKYFQKKGLWELPPILDLVKPTLFKDEMGTS